MPEIVDYELIRQDQFGAMRNLTSVWKLAEGSDANLGTGQVGPQTAEMTQSSAGKLLTMMQRCTGISLQGKRFLDIGCCHGLVCLLASYMGASRASGIDIYQHAIDWANKQYLKNYDGLEYRSQRMCIQLALQDLREYKFEVERPEFVLAFNADWPADTMAACVKLMVDNARVWRVWASGRSLHFLTNNFLRSPERAGKTCEIRHPGSKLERDRLKFALLGSIAQVGQVSVRLCISQQQRTLYIFRSLLPPAQK